MEISCDYDLEDLREAIEDMRYDEDKKIWYIRFPAFIGDNIIHSEQDLLWVIERGKMPNYVDALRRVNETLCVKVVERLDTENVKYVTGEDGGGRHICEGRDPCPVWDCETMISEGSFVRDQVKYMRMSGMKACAIQGFVCVGCGIQMIIGLNCDRFNNTRFGRCDNCCTNRDVDLKDPVVAAILREERYVMHPFNFPDGYSEICRVCKCDLSPHVNLCPKNCGFQVARCIRCDRQWVNSRILNLMCRVCLVMLNEENSSFRQRKMSRPICEKCSCVPAHVNYQGYEEMMEKVSRGEIISLDGFDCFGQPYPYYDPVKDQLIHRISSWPLFCHKVKNFCTKNEISNLIYKSGVDCDHVAMTIRFSYEHVFPLDSVKIDDYLIVSKLACLEKFCDLVGLDMTTEGMMRLVQLDYRSIAKILMDNYDRWSKEEFRLHLCIDSDPLDFRLLDLYKPHCLFVYIGKIRAVRLCERIKRVDPDYVSYDLDGPKVNFRYKFSVIVLDDNLFCRYDPGHIVTFVKPFLMHGSYLLFKMDFVSYDYLFYLACKNITLKYDDKIYYGYDCFLNFMESKDISVCSLQIGENCDKQVLCQYSP